MVSPTFSMRSWRSRLSFRVISWRSDISSDAGPFCNLTVCRLSIVVQVSCEIQDRRRASRGSNRAGFSLCSRSVLSFMLPVTSEVDVGAIFGMVDRRRAICRCVVASAPSKVIQSA